MKRTIAVLSFSLLLAVAFFQPGRGQSSLVHQLAPGVFTRDAEPAKRIIANTSWVEFRDYVVVIDANFPWGARAILNDLRQTTRKPVRIVFDTHYHGDHLFGNSVWVDAGATILCSEDCTAESKAKNTKGWANDKANGEYSLQPYRLEHPQMSFRGTFAIDDGTRRLELIQVGPAHTKGDAVAWLPAERVLFTGDVVVNGTGHYLGDPDANLEHWVTAFDQMAALNPTAVVPGHGATGTADIIRGDQAFLADLVKQVKAGRARGATVEELAEKIDLSKHGAWGSDANRNKAAIRTVYAQLSGRRP